MGIQHNKATSGIPRTFLSGRSTHLEDQNEKENEENFQEIWENLQEMFSSWSPRSERLATLLKATLILQWGRGKSRLTIKHIAMARQSSKYNRWERWSSLFVCRTNKLSCYGSMLNCSQAVFARHECTLNVDSENSFMVSNRKIENSGQLKVSPKFCPSQKSFWDIAFRKTYINCHNHNYL